MKIQKLTLGLFLAVALLFPQVSALKAEEPEKCPIPLQDVPGLPKRIETTIQTILDTKHVSDDPAQPTYSKFGIKLLEVFAEGYEAGAKLTDNVADLDSYDLNILNFELGSTLRKFPELSHIDESTCRDEEGFDTYIQIWFYTDKDSVDGILDKKYLENWKLQQQSGENKPKPVPEPVYHAPPKQPLELEVDRSTLVVRIVLITSSIIIALLTSAYFFYRFRKPITKLN